MNLKAAQLHSMRTGSWKNMQTERDSLPFFSKQERISTSGTRKQIFWKVSECYQICSRNFQALYVTVKHPWWCKTTFSWKNFQINAQRKQSVKLRIECFSIEFRKTKNDQWQDRHRYYSEPIKTREKSAGKHVTVDFGRTLDWIHEKVARVF